MFQPENCVWHIETSGAICSPQAGLQHPNCPFSVNDGEALESYSLREWSFSVISSLQVIIDIQICGLIKPHKCPILCQFPNSYVIYVWQFRYGQKRRQWE